VTTSAWPAERLKHVAGVAFSSVDKKSVEGQIPVKLCNYTDVYYKDEITADLPFMEATASLDQVRSFTLRAGDVLITKDSEAADDIGVAAFVPETLDGVVCGYHLAVLRPRRDRVDPRYLFWGMASAYAREQMSVSASGVTRFGLRFGDVGDLRLLVPELDRQRAVAQFLDRETARIDDIIAANGRLARLVHLRRRAYADAVLGSGTYPVVRVKSVVHRITSGPRGWAAYFSEEGRPFLRITNVSRDALDVSDGDLMRVNPPDGAEAERTRIEDGDVVVSITADVGSVGVVSGQFVGGHVSQHLALLRTHEARIESRWLALALFASAGQAQLDSARYGGTKTQLSLEDVAEVRVPLPPLDEERAILRRWSDMESVSLGLKAAIEHQMRLLRERRQALITAAVTGQTDAAGDAA